MATIERRKTVAGKPRYRALVRRAGFPSTSRTFGRLADANQWAKDVESDMRAGRYKPARRHERKVFEVIDRYIATYLPAKKTGAKQEQQLLEWRRLIGDYDLQLLRPSDIARARDQLLVTGQNGERSPATVVRYLAALSHAFTVAVKDWAWLDANPCKLLMWPKEPRGRVRFLSEDERFRLLRACAESRCEQLHPVVLLALLTGMRRGEILGLRWENVDLQRHRLILTQTKNNERRQVPLVPRALAVIKTRLNGDARPRAFVFAPRYGGGRALELRYFWTQALRGAGIDNFRFHDLRHTAASYLAMTGATTNEIAEILGHKTLAMVQRYAHLTTGHSAKVLARMESEVFK